MALEPCPDPLANWAADAARLAGLSPADRLLETDCPLVDFVEALRNRGTDLVVDGTLAGWLLGVPDRPRRMAVVLTHTRVREWMRLWLLFYGVVDEELRSLAGLNADYIIEHERVLLRIDFGLIELRVVADGELPPRRRVTIAEGVDVDVSSVASSSEAGRFH